MDWKPMNEAPHDRKIRVKDDEGHIRKMQFRAPHYWDVGNGFLVIADPDLYTAGKDIIRAKEWQEIPA